MTRPSGMSILQWAAATLLLAGGLFFLEVGCGGGGAPTARDDPSRPDKDITVTLRNNNPPGGERIHILASGQSRPQNGLNAPDFTTTTVTIRVGDVERFRAENDVRGEVTAATCGPVTEAAYDRGTGFEVIYLNSNLACLGWR